MTTALTTYMRVAFFLIFSKFIFQISASIKIIMINLQRFVCQQFHRNCFVQEKSKNNQRKWVFLEAGQKRIIKRFHKEKTIYLYKSKPEQYRSCPQEILFFKKNSSCSKIKSEIHYLSSADVAWRRFFLSVTQPT